MVFPPHSTHSLQPLDVVLFSPLSRYYTNELNHYLQRSQGITRITKNIKQLICEYQNVLHTVKPLNEEDILFLLLSRYSRLSGACVYVEIKRPGEVQIFDLAIVEPLV